MFFTKYIALLALPILAVATPGGLPPTTTTITVTAPASSSVPASQCNTGAIQCCSSVQSSTSTGVSTLLGLLGVVLQGVAVPVGLTCSPLTVIGLSSGACTAAPVCCENNNFNGLIALGCIPITL